MCFTPCTVAIEFSSLRATSVSSCEGEAPGRLALTVTVGRSISGKFWIFIARNAITPASVRRMKRRIAGIGLRIDQAETFMVLLCTHRCLGTIDHSYEIPIGEERRAARHHAGCRIDAFGDLDAIAEAPPGRDLQLRDAAVGLDAVNVAEALAHDDGRLRQRERVDLAELELAAREHAGARAARPWQVDVHDRVSRLRVDGGRDHAHLALDALRFVARRGDAYGGAGLDAGKLG